MQCTCIHIQTVLKVSQCVFFSGAESHFKVVIVADAFVAKSRLQVCVRIVLATMDTYCSHVTENGKNEGY